MTTKTILLSAALALGLATTANAAVTPAPISQVGGAIVKVAEGCGPNEWRGPKGFCHPMATNRLCPKGFHIGPEGKRCWPNE
jgi:hypothetical protein